jgi:hypothetical protein
MTSERQIWGCRRGGGVFSQWVLRSFFACLLVIYDSPLNGYALFFYCHPVWVKYKTTVKVDIYVCLTLSFTAWAREKALCQELWVWYARQPSLFAGDVNAVLDTVKNKALKQAFLRSPGFYLQTPSFPARFLGRIFFFNNPNPDGSRRIWLLKLWTVITPHRLE